MPLPTIPSGNVFSSLPTGYDVANSCRFNDGDTPTLEKSLGTPSSQTIFTWSCWFKRGVLTGDQSLFSCGSSGDTERFDFRLNSGGEFYFNIDLAVNYRIQTTRLFRDVSAWYNFVLAYDTTQSTDTNRVKLWVNGVQQTGSLITVTNYPAEDYVITAMASGQNVSIGKRQYGSALNLDGYLAEVCYCDGQALTASDFGEFSEDSPTIWMPKDVSGLTFGNNGFYLDFKDSANLGNDANGGTDLTEANLAAADQATDTPTNNFATGNPLYRAVGGAFSEGNNMNVGAGNWFTMASTIGVSAGKWYAEFKLSSGTNSHVGVCGDYRITQQAEGDYGFGSNYGNPSIGLHQSGNLYVNTPGPGTSWSGGQSTGDIVGLALDMDNRKAYWHKNGDWASGSGAWGSSTFNSSTGAQTLDVGDYALVNNWFMGCSGNSSTQQANFGGCSAFAVSSANADGNGYGSFEYAVPSGYYALCTKNLAEFG